MACIFTYQTRFIPEQCYKAQLFGYQFSNGINIHPKLFHKFKTWQLNKVTNIKLYQYNIDKYISQ